MECVRRQIEVKYVAHNRVGCVCVCVCVHAHMLIVIWTSSPLIPPQAVHLAQTDCEAQQSPENWVNYTCLCVGYCA